MDCSVLYGKMPSFSYRWRHFHSSAVPFLSGITKPLCVHCKKLPCHSNLYSFYTRNSPFSAYHTVQSPSSPPRSPLISCRNLRAPLRLKILLIKAKPNREFSIFYFSFFKNSPVCNLCRDCSVLYGKLTTFSYRWRHFHSSAVLFSSGIAKPLFFRDEYVSYDSCGSAASCPSFVLRKLAQ